MSDRLNPIFLYEIRRAVRNRSILTFFCGYLVLLLCGIGFRFLVELETGRSITVDDHMGGDLAAIILCLLYGYTLAVTLFFSIRSALFDTFVDELAAQTGLDWKRTAIGKVQVSVGLAFLFYSATLPFLTLAWTLGGVDLFSLSCVLLLMFLATVVLDSYLTASLIRCRNGYDFLGSALGILFASPPLYGLGCVPFVGVAAVGDNIRNEVPSGIFAAFLLTLAAILYVGFSISRSLFAANWRRRPAEDRFFNVWMLPWIAGFVIFVLAFLVVGIISIFV